MMPVLYKVNINLELMTYFNIIDTWVYLSVIRTAHQIRTMEDIIINVNDEE